MEEKKMKAMERYQQLIRELFELVDKIEKYSTYNAKDIGDVIARLMSTFEGAEFICKEEHSYFYYSKYKIEEKEESDLHLGISLMDDVRENRITGLYIPKEKEDSCVLYPIGYTDEFVSKREELRYVQDFVDYLFEKRFELELDKIDVNKLNEILEEYLECTKDKQVERKNTRFKQIEKIKAKKKRQEFEEKCMVDRESLFSAVEHIINDYENVLLDAILEYKSEWEYAFSSSTLNLNRKLYIRNGKERIFYTALIDSDTVYPNEEEWASVDENKQGTVNFFEFKNKFISIYRDSDYFKIFMDMIENMYSEKLEVNADDINSILTDIDTMYKGKARTLKK